MDKISGPHLGDEERNMAKYSRDDGIQGRFGGDEEAIVREMDKISGPHLGDEERSMANVAKG
jgi:hypothetical protein